MAPMDDYSCIFPPVHSILLPLMGCLKADVNAPFLESLNRYGIRIILFCSILRPVVEIGPSNCLRTLLMYHDQTLETMKELDYTFLPLHHWFNSGNPGHMDYALPSSFCQPGI